MYHANLIQGRKEIEMEILESTETLIDYPLATAPYNSSNPSPIDAEAFKEMLQPFQPSDYDALILERNLDSRCGYCLCGNARVKSGGAGRYRIIGMNGKAKDFKVVNKEEVEKWCSDACAKRALYVRVQLSEVPAWERGFTAGRRGKIDLLDEPKSEEDVVMDGLAELDLQDKEDKKQDAADLALERGDKGYAAKNGLVDVTVREKEVSGVVEAPSLGSDDLSHRLGTMHLELEGYKSTFGSERQRRHERDAEEREAEWRMDLR